MYKNNGKSPETNVSVEGANKCKNEEMDKMEAKQIA